MIHQYFSKLLQNKMQTIKTRGVIKHQSQKVVLLYAIETKKNSADF